MGSSDLSCLRASIIYRLRINCRSMEKIFVGIPSLIRNDQTDYMMIRHILIRAHMEQHAHNTYIYITELNITLDVYMHYIHHFHDNPFIPYLIRCVSH